MKPFRLSPLFVVLFVSTASRLPAEELPPNFLTFFDNYCIDCHDPDTAKGDFHIDFLQISETPEDAEYWQLVLDNLHLGEMPPEDKKQPAIQELEPVIAWVEAELQRAAHDLNGLTGEVVLRRMNRFEYENTIDDLFGVRGDFAEAFPEDMREEGFDNIGSALQLSAEQVDQYLNAAEFVLERAIVTKPRPETKRKPFTLADLNAEIEKGLAKRREYEKRNPPSETERKRREAEAKKGNRGHHYYPKHGDDFLIPMRYTKPSTKDMFRVREPGWYRFKLVGYAARNPDELPLRVRVTHGSFRQGTVAEVAGVAQFTTTEPQEHEYRVYLETNDRVQLEMLDGPNWMWGSRISENTEPVVAIRSMEIEGPLLDQWPPKGHQLLLGKRDANALTDAGAKAALAECAPKLFRRPVSAQLLGEITAFYDSARADSAELEAFQLTLKAMMASPQFVYHVEPGARPDDFALANRLAFFLWRSVPDAELLALAKERSLSRPDELKRQVDRLLGDERSERFLRDFTDQWLDIRKVGEIQPDANLYPEYDAELERAMVTETRAFVREILHQDLSLKNLIASDWAMLNDRMASHYGIPGVEGNRFRRVSLTPAETVRGGLLTQASILNVTSNGTVTSPVVRGVWVLERLMGTPPPPPPPDVPAIEPDIRGASTIKEQLARHREIAQCASCHAKIDPYGMALENFDVIGAWREKYRALEKTSNPRRPKLVDGQVVVSNDRLPKQGEFADFREFRAMLLQRQDLLFDNMAHKLAVYALGRKMDFADQIVLDEIAEGAKSAGGGMKTMIHRLVASELFKNP